MLQNLKIINITNHMHAEDGKFAIIETIYNSSMGTIYFKNYSAEFILLIWILDFINNKNIIDICLYRNCVDKTFA